MIVKHFTFFREFTRMAFYLLGFYSGAFLQTKYTRIQLYGCTVLALNIIAKKYVYRT